MVDESISGFLETVAKHPALTNNKDAIKPGHQEQCSKLYIQLLEKVFDSFDKIPNSLKENIPGYDRRIFEKVKLLQMKLKQILAKPDSVSAQESQSVIDTDNDDSINESGLESSGPHSICIQNGAHNSGTSTSVPPSPQDKEKKKSFFQKPSSFTLEEIESTSKRNRDLSEQDKGAKNYLIKKPPTIVIEYNKEVPPSSSEKMINALEILNPLTAVDTPKRAPVGQNFARFQRPLLSKNSLPNNNRPSTDSVKDNKCSEPRDEYSVPINVGNDTNITPKAAEVSNNSVFGAASSSHVEEGNRLFDVPVDEFGWQRYSEKDFETGNRHLSEQDKGAKNCLIKKPPAIVIEYNKEVPPSSSEKMINALEILNPLTAVDTPKRAPVGQNFARFQRPLLSKNSLPNNNRPSTDSVKDNKCSEPRDEYSVPINVGNDTNITPKAAEVSNNSVFGAASSSHVEEGNRLFDVPVDEFGWQRYSEKDFETGNRHLSEKVIGQERDKNCLLKKSPRVTIDYNKELPPSTAEMIRNAPEILKPLTATASLKCAPEANSSVGFQPTQLLNSNRLSTNSVKDNKEDEPIVDYKVPIDMDDKTDSMLEAALASADISLSVANTSDAGVVNSALDIHVDEDGWQVYRPEDFEENVEDIGNQEPQVGDVMKNSGDTGHRASIQNDGITGEFDGCDYPHSALMLAVFHDTFGLTTFRPNQLQVINATLLGYDCFVLMPTGGGKSLCYQLPAILMPGVTVVISPLKSLILDQVNKLLSLNIPAAHLSGDLSQNTCDEIYQKLSLLEPTLKLLYVTPEKISGAKQLQSTLSELYSRGKLARFVIDEAHCVSQWGHDFRPDYKRLSVLRSKFPNTSIMALTATATPRVRMDILHQLRVSACKWFLSSFNRPNLVYRILDKNPRSINQDVVAVIKEQFDGLSGIVYCLSRKDCVKLTADLRVAGVLAEFYHGGRTDKKREEVQAGWAAGTYKVICATIAFGMGVDKADVRFVIHHSMPKSVEGYYQETGRAGRDGDTAICLLYYSYSDVTRYGLLICSDRNRTPETVHMHLKNLSSMVEVCESVTECRREQLLAYLGEQYERADCMRDCNTACDNCLNEDNYEQVDVTEDCKQIVRSIREITSGPRASFTLLQVADALRGAMQARLQALQNTPLHGRLTSWSRTDVIRLLRQMLVLRFLATDVSDNNNNNPNTYVAAGPNADILLSGEQRILFAVKEQPVGAEACDGPANKRARIDPALGNNASNAGVGTSRSGETHQGPN